MSRRGSNNNLMPTRASPPPPPGSSNNFFPIRRLPSRRPPPPSPPPPWTRHPRHHFEVPLQDGREDFLDPWIPIEFPSFLIPHNHGHFILLNETPRIEMNPWLRQPIPEFPAAREEAESRLTKEEQNKALKKLRKEIYNPAPKTTPKAMTRRLGLYYRDSGINYGREKVREDEDDDGKRCAVCLDDFEGGQLVMLTPCNHMFHEECIVPWVKSHGQCPVCRFAICERFGERSNARNNNNNSNAAQDLFAGELVAIARDMEETMALAGEMH